MDVILEVLSIHFDVDLHFFLLSFIHFIQSGLHKSGLGYEVSSICLLSQKNEMSWSDYRNKPSDCSGWKACYYYDYPLPENSFGGAESIVF